MSLLDKKFKIKNSKGEIQEIKMYSDIEDVQDKEHYLEIETQSDDQYKIKAYIGMTSNIDSQDASDVFIFFNNKEYRLLK